MLALVGVGAGLRPHALGVDLGVLRSQVGVADAHVVYRLERVTTVWHSSRGPRVIRELSQHVLMLLTAHGRCCLALPLLAILLEEGIAKEDASSVADRVLGAFVHLAIETRIAICPSSLVFLEPYGGAASVLMDLHPGWMVVD